MKKRLLSLALALILCLSLTVPALALETSKVGQGITVSASDGNIAVIDENGSLWMRGNSSLIGIGNSNYLETTSEFTKVMDNVNTVQTWDDTTVAVKTDGSLWVWGYNPMYEYDTVTSEPMKILSPRKIMDNVIFATCANRRVAAIKADGSLWMLGDNSKGQLGNGTTDYTSVPIKVMDDVATVSCNGNITAVIKKDGSLWVWGEDGYGMLTIEGEECNTRKKPYASSNSYYYCQTLPIKVMDNVAAVTCTKGNVAAIKKDGSLWMWGSNAGGQLLDGYAGTFRHSVKPRKMMDNVVSVSGGYGHIAAVTADGSLWSWGYNSLGQVGNDNKATHHYDDGTPLQLKPVIIADDVASVSCGFSTTVFTKKDGSIWACGRIDNYSTLSNTTNRNGISIQSVPAKLAGVTAKLSSTAKIAEKVGGFDDVLETAYYADPVLWAVKQGITGGTTATTFSPNQTCTTAHILTFLWRAKGSPEPTSKTNPFVDVKESDYFYKAALWAKENGILTTTGSTFNGSSPCTRSMAVLYIWRAEGSCGANTTSSFTDVARTTVYAPAVDWAVEQGVTGGTTATTFSPDRTCTRAQIVTFLYRAFAK